MLFSRGGGDSGKSDVATNTSERAWRIKKNNVSSVEQSTPSVDDSALAPALMKPTRIVSGLLSKRKQSVMVYRSGMRPVRLLKWLHITLSLRVITRHLIPLLHRNPLISDIGDSFRMGTFGRKSDLQLAI